MHQTSHPTATLLAVAHCCSRCLHRIDVGVKQVVNIALALFAEAGGRREGSGTSVGLNKASDH